MAADDAGPGEAARVIAAARDAGLTVACAESITGGLVAAALTSVPGASAVFLGGIVAYTADAKEELLGVPSSIIAAEGLVSEAVAESMAWGAAGAFGATVAVGTTGAAGPDSHAGAAPGTAWVVAVRSGLVVRRLVDVVGNRHEVREACANAALRALCDVIDV